MAVSLLNRPLGHGLGIVYNCTITNSGGDALVTMAEPPPDDYWVYIHSNIERYNGFVNITLTGLTTFKISRQEEGDFIAYIQDADIELQISLLDHSWQSVHLPIVYELESDLFPINEVDEERTVLSFTNLNGYTYFTLSDSLGSFEALDFVKIVGAESSEVNGVFQILYRNAGDILSIDLAYNAGYDFTGATVQLYKSNYFVTAEVYSGLESGHRWESQKPSRLVATLLLIPDENNQLKFSISEILKGDINTRNNLTLDTLPNNLDFYTQFHIAYRESYDLADDGEIVVFEGDQTVDDFIGNAVNSQMPFKSVNESFMSEYVTYPAHSARWLTLQDRPAAIVGYFFDLSFLLASDSDVNVTIFKSSGSSVNSTETIEIPNPGTGVIRIPFIPESGYDLYCLQASAPGSNEPLSLASFANTSTGVAWTTGATPSVSVTLNQTTQILFLAYAFQVGVEYSITGNFNHNITAVGGTLRLGVYDGSNNLLDSQTEVVGGVGSNSITLSFTGVSGAARIGFRTSLGAIAGTVSFTMTGVNIVTEGSVITEQICVNILQECDDTFVNDNLRITENGFFRELE